MLSNGGRAVASTAYCLVKFYSDLLKFQQIQACCKRVLFSSLQQTRNEQKCLILAYFWVNLQIPPGLPHQAVQHPMFTKMQIQDCVFWFCFKSGEHHMLRFCNESFCTVLINTVCLSWTFEVSGSSATNLNRRRI